MSTVYDPDARTVKHASVAIFLLTVTLGVIGPLSFSGGWWLYGCLSLAAFTYMFYIRYLCERYTLFASGYFTLLIFLLAFAPACVGYTVVTDDLGGSALAGGLATLLILASVMLTYLYIYLTPKKNFHLKCPAIKSLSVLLIHPASSQVLSLVVGHGSRQQLSSLLPRSQQAYLLFCYFYSGVFSCSSTPVILLEACAPSASRRKACPPPTPSCKSTRFARPVTARGWAGCSSGSPQGAKSGVDVGVSSRAGLAVQWALAEFGIDKKIGELLDIERP